MPWFKVDDEFWHCKKVRKLGSDKSALSTWLLAGVWSADNLTDGFVPWEIIAMWDPSRTHARALMNVGLWGDACEDGEDGVLFHDWADYQRTAEEVKADRAYNARKTALYRDQELVEAVRSRDGDRCRYCGVLVDWRDRRSATGATYDCVDAQVANTVANVVVSCRGCTTRKNGKPLVETGMTLLEPRSLGVATSVSSTELELFKSPTRPVPNKTKDSPDGSSRDADFERFWAAYPRRVDRKKARKSWNSAIKRADVATVLAGAERYRERERGNQQQYIKYPTTWLNNDCWEDEPDASVSAEVTRESATEWVRGEWRAGRVRPIEERTGLRYPMPDLPLSVNGKEQIEGFYVQAAKDWITGNFDEIVRRLTVRAVA